MTRRYSGRIGYGIAVENPANSGVWEDTIVERPYRGDVVRNTRVVNDTDKVLTDVSVSNSISIVADTFAINNFRYIKYVEWMGAFWTVTNVEVQRPRLILSLGEVYNGPTT
jgi:hypothetical protein